MGTKTSSHVMSEMGKMNGLVRQWLEYLKGTPEAVKIFTNMEKIRLLEQRKIHFQTSFDKAIGDLRDEMQTLVRQAMRDCRINDLRKFEPDLVNLEIQGKSKYVIVKLTPQEDSRPESVLSVLKIIFKSESSIVIIRQFLIRLPIHQKF